MGSFMALEFIGLKEAEDSARMVDKKNLLRHFAPELMRANHLSLRDGDSPVAWSSRKRNSDIDRPVRYSSR